MPAPRLWQHHRPAAIRPGLAPGAGRPRAEKATATPAGKSLDRAQRALDQAAKTEKQLRASLKKHSKAVSAARDDLDRRDRELKAMKAQLKTAKKSRKRATRELGTSAKLACSEEIRRDDDRSHLSCVIDDVVHRGCGGLADGMYQVSRGEWLPSLTALLEMPVACSRPAASPRFGLRQRGLT